MGESLMQRSFAAGEIAPGHAARADLVKYLTGLRTCRNFIVRAEGGVTNRAGFRFVDALKATTAGARIFPFHRTSGSGVVIEVGNGYFRFFVDGAAVEVAGVAAYNGATNYVPGDLFSDAGVNYYVHTATVGTAAPNAGFYHPLTGTIYEIPTPYVLGSLPKFDQSGSILTLTHRTQKPRELVYSTLTRWVLRDVSTASSVATPAALVATGVGAGTVKINYVVTAAKAETYEESNASAADDATGDQPTTAAPNSLTWTAVAGAAEYYVYADPYANGVFGYIGTASTNSFKDAGFVPDFNVTPPVSRILFNSVNNYPECAAHYQQRRMFANLDVDPQAVYGSRVGFESNFGISSPLQDDDAITFKLAGDGDHATRFMVALKTGLCLFTDGGEWTVTGTGGPKSALTPSSIAPDQETYVGIDPNVPPSVIGNAILYLQARGRILREIKFDQAVEGLAGRDLTVFAKHLFKSVTVQHVAYQQNPDSILWCSRSDGVLLGLTYIPEQEVWGWHQHTTDGSIESLAVVAETSQDVLYAIISRTIGGTTKRYLERLENREIRIGFFNADSFFVDCGLSYSGAGANSFSGLDHLNGRVVAVLADGVVLNDGDPAGANAATYTVTAGVIDLPDATLYQNVHLGLRIPNVEMEMLDLDVQGSSIRDKGKRVASVALLLEDSSMGFEVAPWDASTGDWRAVDVEDWESASRVTGQVDVLIPADYNKYGRVRIRQTLPLPLTVLGVIPNLELGG